MASRMRLLESLQEPELADVLGAWRSERPRMGVLALVAEADREAAVPALQAACARLEVPLCGAVFPALLDRDVFVRRGLLLLRFDEMPPFALYAPLGPSHPAVPATVERLAGDLAARLDQPGEQALFLVFDATVVNIATLLDELYLRLADRVRYMGVNAGSETFRPMPCLFDNTRLVQDGVLAVLLPDHPGAVVEHGFRAPERMISATSTDGNRIITIDWEPAFEVYREVVRAEYGVAIDASSFYRFAVHFPFGIVRARGEIVVRIPVALEADGSLFCVGEVPPNAVLTLLRPEEVDSARTVEALASGLRHNHGDLRQAELLTFYCAGRRLHLGQRARQELALLAERTGAARLSGALSLGEIGHSLQWGCPLFHNAALVCCRWG